MNARTAAEPESSWDGAQYEKISALQRRVGLAFIDALELDDTHRILDVGCGDGYLTERIAEHSSADVIGLDASPAMIERARERNSERVSFVGGDVTTMRFDEPFDLVVSLNTLHWVLDLPAAFARLFEAQAAGGRFVGQLVGASTAPSIEDIAVAVTEGTAWRQYFRTEYFRTGTGEPFRPFVHPTENALRDIARHAGYHGVETSAWTERFTFTTEAHFRRWCAAGMSVWTNRIPADRRSAFIDEVTSRYSQHHDSQHHDSQHHGSQHHGAHGVFEFSQVRLSGRRPPAPITP